MNNEKNFVVMWETKEESFIEYFESESEAYVFVQDILIPQMERYFEDSEGQKPNWDVQILKIQAIVNEENFTIRKV